MPDTTAPQTDPAIDSLPTDSPQPDGWTIMVYIAGDAALSASMISQLKEFTDAGFQENTNVLVYFDPNCNGRNARIFDVNRRRREFFTRKYNTPTFIGDARDPFVRNIAEDCEIQALPQLPASLTLRYFLEYSNHYYRAKNYMLFLLGHGVIVGNDEFLPDTDDDSSLTLADLGTILKNFGKKVRKQGDEFHLVAFHSCSMSSVELAFELQDSARYMMGTQGSAFPGSWPYRQLLKKLFNAIDNSKNPRATQYPNALVRKILTGLQDLSFYNALDFWNAGFSADLTMCSLDKNKVETLKTPLQNLVKELRQGLENGARESILLAHWESQSYFGESYTDLFDLCQCLQKYCPQKDGYQNGIWQACEEVKKALQSDKSDDDPEGAFDRLVVFTDYFGPSYQHSNGLSIYFPWRTPPPKVIESYKNYQFTNNSSNSWLEFLNDYFYMTKRPMKGQETATKEPVDTSTPQPPQRAAWNKLSDEALLRLGPPPRHRKIALARAMAKLAKQLETLAKETGTLSETDNESGSLYKEMGTLAKELGTLGKEIGSLAESGKEMGTLAKELGTLAAKLGTMEKETGTLAEIGKETATLAKETATLAKETATLAKETGTLAKETGSLATTSKETATLSKETGTLAKEMASLAKETASLGLFGITVVKNFDAPEGVPITSRPQGNPDRHRW